MNTKRVRYLCEAGAIAGLYAALTLLLAPISFGQLQCRVAEALTLLPVLTPAAIPGLSAGCLIANLLFGAPWQDVVFGTLATLIAAVLTRSFRKNLWIAAVWPVLCNGVIVGIMLSAVYALPYPLTMASVALGEAVAVFALGVPLVRLLQKHTTLFR